MIRQVYFGNWKNKSDMWADFSNDYTYESSGRVAKDPEPEGEILLAWYGNGSYEGSAFVVFRNDGKLYEVNGGHCSCYGLEGQWSPEECTVESLRKTGEFALRSDYYDATEEAKISFGELLKELS